MDRLLAGAKTVKAPYFAQLMMSMIDTSAAGSHRPTGMGLVGRILADIANGGAPSVEQQRRQQRNSRGRGGGGGDDNDSSNG